MFESEELLFQDQEQEDVPNDSTGGDSEDPQTSLPSLRKQLKNLSLAKTILEGHENSYYSSLRAISGEQASVRLDISTNALQSTTNEFFNLCARVYTRSLNSWNPVVIETDFGTPPHFNKREPTVLVVYFELSVLFLVKLWS